MIRRLLARINARFQAWLDYNVITDAPAGDLGSLDVRNGLGECPCGEVLPESAIRALAGDVPMPSTEQAERLMAEITKAPFADWEDTRAEAEWDNHVDDALAVANDPWNDADRASAAAWGVAL